MKTYIHILFLLAFTLTINAQTKEENSFTSRDISVSKHIDGTLLTPIKNNNNTLAIIIAGSGPTNRDGNQNFLKTNNLKKLAEGLTNKGISTYRYDKRVVKQIKQRNVDKNTMFSDFIDDAKDVITFFKRSKQYEKIIVIGHSQGSLVGMVAAKDLADGFVSLAGAARPIDTILVEQIEKTAPQFLEDSKKVLATLSEGKTTNNFPSALSSVFNLSVQPFIANWMSYNPSEIIKSLDMPILLINGTKDLQVPVKEAEALKMIAGDKATLKIIENMNHVLVNIEGGNLENSKSYNEPYRALSNGLINSINTFINK